MANPKSPLRIGSKVRVTNHGQGKVHAFYGEESQVIEVALDKGGFVTARKDQVKRVEAEE